MSTRPTLWFQNSDSVTSVITLASIWTLHSISLGYTPLLDNFQTSVCLSEILGHVIVGSWAQCKSWSQCPNLPNLPCLWLSSAVHLLLTKPLVKPTRPTPHPHVIPKSCYTTSIQWYVCSPILWAIGSLMYVVLGTCPDITSSVSFLSQFMQNPRKLHWEAIKGFLGI